MKFSSSSVLFVHSFKIMTDELLCVNEEIMNECGLHIEKIVVIHFELSFTNWILVSHLLYSLQLTDCLKLSLKFI